MSLRDVARKVPLLYRIAGYARRLQYRSALSRAEKDHVDGAGFPPPKLRYRVHRSFDLASYRQVGKSVADSIADVLEANAIGLIGKVVLDLGSGPGRVASWVKHRFPACELHGSDIDGEAVDWAEEHLSAVAKFHLNGKEPPTGFASGSFDFVYCISLFTHLDSDLQDAWLGELRRLVKTGGHVLATTHGRLAQDSCTDRERAKIDGHGFHFRVDRRGALKIDGLPDFYQTTFHSKAYIHAHWAWFFEIVDYMEGGIDGHQDIVLMRRL